MSTSARESRPPRSRTLGVHERYRSVSLTGHFERSAIEAIGRRLTVPIGDDTAVVAAPAEGQRLLLAADVVVEGVHFDLDLVGLDDVGWKALAVNVSDIAAMGGEPANALVSVVVPPGCDLDRLYDGLTEAAAVYGCPIVGGDLSAGERLVVSVAITGTVDGEPVLRSGARPGDALVVSGPLGAAAAAFAARPVGDAHRRPQARLAEGREARAAGATAMMDLSDGLALDVRRLAEASGVGVALDDLPVAPGATLDQALGGGEDYELLAAIDDPGRLPGWLVIGCCTDDPGERRLGDGPLPEGGWEHRW
jgi:thiamine-monophosphate kinase